MVFLPGDHALDNNITVANVVRLTMCGESSSGNRTTVVCKGPVGFTFTSIKDFKICFLAFTLCSRNYGGGNYAVLLQSVQHVELINCSFHDNIGSALVMHNTSITLAGNSEFTQNHCTCESNACTGGRGLTASASNLTFIGNTTFLENSAMSFGSGGAIYADSTVLNFEGTSNFISNSADWGGAISTSDNTILAFNGTSNFIGNSALLTGGAICTDSTLVVNGIINFINNSAGLGGALYTSGTVLTINGISNFIDNSAIYGGAIRADITSTLTFNGTTNFINNGYNQGRMDTVIYIGNTTYGGGMFMMPNTSLLIFPNTTIYWVNNHATFGGAIYVADATELSYCTTAATQEECFFQLPSQNLSSINAQLVFKNNSADAAGSVLYGGAVDNCKLTGHSSNSSGEVFDLLVHIDDGNTDSNISSFPFHICHCKSDHPDCSVSKVYRAVYPGETFSFSVVGVVQRNGNVPASVIGNINTGNLLGIQYLQHTQTPCTTLNYTVFSLHNGDLELYADGPCFAFSSALNIDLTIHQNCPPGFAISLSARSCVCEQRLAKYTTNCNITNGVGQITRDSIQQFWVGYDDQLEGQSDKLILYPFCPFDYCTSKTVVFTLNNADIQCAYKRSGLLCGACKDGYSLILGTSQCRKCTNSHLTLLIVFALMGVVLVFLLLVCKLTVATGTLSGLVFYANIVGANRIIFLPVESTNPILSVFIAWLNLDFGIETCFYNGLDVYSKTWLQFVFPVYIWLLIGLVILFSHYSRRFANLLGSNPVSVLATLILLSYTKILRTLIAVIYVTYIEYPTYNRWVWLYDANIDYLSGKHIPLFAVAVLVFLFLFLPYTFLLLFGQWLQAISHLRLFSWVNNARLKPFMDSYHAPYKAKHRYWPGVLLVLRFGLLLVFAFEFNPQQDTSINLLAILVGIGILHFWAWISGGVYRNWCLNVLEGSFALNLIILASSTYHVQLTGGNQLIAGNTSVSIAFAEFIGILTYHILRQLRHTEIWKKVPKLNLKFNRPNNVNDGNNPVNNPMEDEDFDQLREPLLEDRPQAQYGAF